MAKCKPNLWKTDNEKGKAANIEKGSAEPHVNKVGSVTRKQLEEIASAKMPDLTAKDMDAAVRTIAGSARAAGIETEGVK